MSKGPEQKYQDKAPKGVTLTGWGTLLLGLVNVWRALGLWRQIDLLLDLGVATDPRLRLAISVAWAMLFGAATLTIWRRKRAAQWLAPGTLAVYGAYRILLSIAAAQATGQDVRIVGSLIFYGVLALFAVWAMNRPKAKRYFSGENQFV